MRRAQDASTGINPNRREPPLIISLTSYPPRFGSLRITLETLLQQSCKPDRIQLWLYRDDLQNAELAGWLTAMKARGLEVRVAEEVHGPYRKLLPSLRRYPDGVIVTADDDTLYPRDWLAGLYDTHLAHPNDIVCYRARRIGLNARGGLAPYRYWQVDNHSKAGLHLFPTGVSGVLYPPGSLDPLVGDVDVAQRLSPMADDIWFKAASLRQGTTCTKVHNRSVSFLEVPGSQKSGLFRQNLRHDRYDAKLHAVFRHLQLTDLFDGAFVG